MTSCNYDLSIIVVSFNTKDLTRECLNSIFRNSFQLSLQVIVVDNNSDDGSVEMIRAEFPDVYLVLNQKNIGFAAANNKGFTLCQSNYILLLNSDTVILGDVLKTSTEYLKSHKHVGAMGCQVLNPDLSIQLTCSGYPTLSRLLIMTMALDKFPGLSFLDSYLMRAWRRDNEREIEVISGCFLMIRKAILTTVGGLDERFFFFAEETDWCRRIREAGWVTMFSPVGKIIHLGGGSVKKLNYQRDVMLTSALVKLHRKHAGFFGGIIAYLLLGFFNLSRAVFWTICSIFEESKKDRALHFCKVTQSLKSCWSD